MQYSHDKFRVSIGVQLVMLVLVIQLLYLYWHNEWWVNRETSIKQHFAIECLMLKKKSQSRICYVMKEELDAEKCPNNNIIF